MRKKMLIGCVAMVVAALTVFAASAAASQGPAGAGGWPAGSGVPGGDATGCSPIILTSSPVSPGYGFIDFDVRSGVVFASLGLFGSWSLLSGTQAQDNPYLRVEFTDGTYVFVYSVEANGAGTGTYYTDDSTHNTYHDRSYALANYGNREVSDVGLIVENGDLSIQVNGVLNDNCPEVALPPEQTDHAYLCYSVGGNPYVAQTEPFNDARVLMAAGYWNPSALPGNIAGGTNVGGYHLVCGEPRRFGPGNARFATTYVDHNGQTYPYTPGLQREFIGKYPLES